MSFEYPYYSVSKIKDFFKEFNASPRKKWGQNFLIDPNTISFIINSIPKEILETTENISEIGPGLGALSYKIIELNKTFTVFEIDPILIQNLKNLNLSISEIYEGDVLENFSFIENQKLILLGNLPYYISTDIIVQALKKLTNLQFGIFMLQKEFAFRISNEISSLSLFSIAFGEFKYLKTISPNCFYPKPDASSALISYKPNQVRYTREKIDNYELFLKAIFWGKRKTMNTSLRESPFLNEEHKIYFEEILNRIKFPINKRPEELNKQKYLELLGEL